MRVRQESALIYGSKEFAQVIESLVESSGYRSCGYIDDFGSVGEKVIGTFHEACLLHPPGDCVIFVAIGYQNLAARRKVFERVWSKGYETPSLVHESAYVDPSATIGRGSVVMAHSVVDMRATLEEQVVLWPGAVVNHDAVIRSNVFLSPNSTVCGYTEVGQDVFVGAAATITDHVHVPAGTFIKAGSVFSGR